MGYYDGTKLLSLKDIDGNEPEIYLCTTNRSAGKTTYFSRLLVKRFLEQGKKFCLVYRYSYELADISDKFFKDIQSLFFPNHSMTSKPVGKGVFYRLLLNDIECGYAVSLNSADSIKKYSHFLSDVSYMFMDEFQSESNHYCSNEITKFISMHKSIARGHGQQNRHVPIYMCSNAVSILNPYYIELGICERLKSDTRFLRGKGYVLEQGLVESAAKAQMDSAFSKAFARSKYIAYSTQNVYLNDSTAFIDKPEGVGRYLATLRYNSCDFAIREYVEQGIVYCDTRVDATHQHKISVTTDDHSVNYVMLKRCDLFLSQLRYFFEQGCFRFKDMRCKEAVLKALSY